LIQESIINQNLIHGCDSIMKDKEKIISAIKDLNSIRAVYHRELEEIEKQYREKKISKEKLEKHKDSYDKRKEKIRDKIQKLEEQLEKLK